MHNKPIYIAFYDLLAAIERTSLIMLLGLQDIRQRYRRSSLGPFWLTISMSIMITTIAIVFSQVFNTPLDDFLLFIALGIILWTFMSSVLIESCSSFIAAENIIKQLPIPLFVHVFRIIWRNILIFFHNILILPIVLIFIGKPLGLISLQSILGFFLVTINLTWMALILATICARYRDMPQILASMVQVTFYLTPIIWTPQSISSEVSIYLMNFNPFYHLIEITRAPLLGYSPSTTNWLVASTISIAGSIFALAFYGKYLRRIAYWL